MTMSVACKSIKKKKKQLPAHSVLIEIYNGIAWFPGDSTALDGRFSEICTANYVSNKDRITRLNGIRSPYNTITVC